MVLSSCCALSMEEEWACFQLPWSGPAHAEAGHVGTLWLSEEAESLFAGHLGNQSFGGDQKWLGIEPKPVWFSG